MLTQSSGGADLEWARGWEQVERERLILGEDLQNLEFPKDGSELPTPIGGQVKAGW